MDSEGNIYMLENNPERDKVIEDLKLIMIPEDEFPTVVNMSQDDKKAWYAERAVV